MADVFISYSKRDPQLTIDLARELEAQGYSTWWDTGLLPGDHFRDKIKTEIDVAKVVIVIWTPISVESKWVYAEAQMADYQRKLITVRSKDVAPNQIPLPFNSYYAAEIDEREKIFFACRRYVTVPSLNTLVSDPLVTYPPPVINENINHRPDLNDMSQFVEFLTKKGRKKRNAPTYDIREASHNYYIHANGDTHVQARFYLECLNKTSDFWMYWIEADKESDEISLLRQLRFHVIDLETGVSLDWLPTSDQAKVKIFAIFWRNTRKSHREIQISYWWPGYSRKLLELGKITFDWRFVSRTPGRESHLRYEWVFLDTDQPITARVMGRQSATASLWCEERSGGVRWIYEDPQAVLGLKGYAIEFASEEIQRARQSKTRRVAR